jgi:hypothetical protein
MAFLLLYEKQNEYLIPTGKQFSLAGNKSGLVYKLWEEKRGKPKDQGWHISADDLVQKCTGGKGTIDTHSLLIDFRPRSKEEIGIIELLDIYAYTYSEDDKASWTPMMLRIRNVLNGKYVSKEEKEEKLKKLKQPSDVEDSVEFLYLQGDNGDWNWGPNGMTNAAFIGGAARVYFRKIF